MNDEQDNSIEMKDLTTATLGERILAAARLAACAHLELEFLERFTTTSFSVGQQVTAGGAGHDRITDDELSSTAEREAV